MDDTHLKPHTPLERGRRLEEQRKQKLEELKNKELVLDLDDEIFSSAAMQKKDSQNPLDSSYQDEDTPRDLPDNKMFAFE